VPDRGSVTRDLLRVPVTELVPQVRVPGDSYSAFKERLCEQLDEAHLADERVGQQRIGKLTANVRREVEDELACQRAEQEATAAAVEAREATVAASERKASLPTGQGLMALSAVVVLSADLLIRTVA
jgi:hypothetical protein